MRALLIIIACLFSTSSSAQTIEWPDVQPLIRAVEADRDAICREVPALQVCRFEFLHTVLKLYSVRASVFKARMKAREQKWLEALEMLEDVRREIAGIGVLHEQMSAKFRAQKR